MKCYNCDSNYVVSEQMAKSFYFRGETLTIPIEVKKCGGCGEIIAREQEQEIIQKLSDKYVEIHKLYQSKDIRFIRNLKGLSCPEMDRQMEFIPGTTHALEKGYAITIKQHIKIEQWLNETKELNTH